MDGFPWAVPDRELYWAAVKPAVHAVTDKVRHHIGSVQSCELLFERHECVSAGRAAGLTRTCENVIRVLPEAFTGKASSILPVVQCLYPTAGREEVICVLGDLDFPPNGEPLEGLPKVLPID
jgi:hypothetical protein